jgi:hypothetical protein
VERLDRTNGYHWQLDHRVVQSTSSQHGSVEQWLAMASGCTPFARELEQLGAIPNTTTESNQRRISCCTDARTTCAWFGVVFVTDLHAYLEEWLSNILTVLLWNGDSELWQHSLINILLSIHNGAEESLDWSQDEDAETTVTLLSGFGGRRVSPLLGVVRQKVITPQTLHHLRTGNSELGCIHGSELLDSKSPTYRETSRKQW